MRKAKIPERASDRRGDARLLTILRVGKLITDRIEELCLVRNVAAGGAMIEVQAPLKPRQRVRIELQRDHPFWGTVLWVNPPIAGIAFDERVDVAAMLMREDRQRAHPRLDIPSGARVVVGGRTRHVTVRDVSQKGVGIVTDEILGPGNEVLIALDGLEPMQGIVRWCGEGIAGIEFTRPISLGVLTAWLYKTFGRCSVERSFVAEKASTNSKDDDEDMGRLLQLM